MNKPSDYTHHRVLSSSSDESQLPTSHTPTRNYQSVSLLVPPAAHHIHHKPKKKSKRKTGKPKTKKRSESDYLILGNSYYLCGNAIELSQRLMKESTPIVPQDQLRRKETRCVRRIEQYMKGFLVTVAKRKQVHGMSSGRKAELLGILREEKAETRAQPEEKLDGLLRGVVESLERKKDELGRKYPQRDRVLTQWKNHKMHQVERARHFLTRQQRLESFDLNRELLSIEEDNFIPQLRREGRQLRVVIESQLVREQEKTAYGQDAGVRWVLERLQAFIADRPGLEQDLEDHLELIREGHEVEEPLLTDEVFVEFEREEVGAGSSAAEQEELSLIHVFNRAVFDLINQSAGELAGLSPSVGELLGLLCLGWEREERREGEQLLWVGGVMVEWLVEEALGQLLDLF